MQMVMATLVLFLNLQEFLSIFGSIHRSIMRVCWVFTV